MNKKNTNEKEMNIVLCADDNYFYAGITMLSILKNTNPERRINFYILFDNMSKKTKERFLSLQTMWNCTIELTDITEYRHYLNIVKWDNHKNDDNHQSLMSYYRILILKIFNARFNKCIYIDSDIIVETDLSTIYDQVSEEFIAGAVVEVGAMQKRQVILKETMQLKEFSNFKIHPNDFPYFNAGLIILNLKFCNKENIFEQILNFLVQNPSPPYADQDSLNAILGQKYRYNMLYFEPSFNVFCNPEYIKYDDAFYPEDKVLYALNNPLVYHFVGSCKPWQGFNDGYRSIWWKYCSISPWHKIVNKNLKPKLNFWEILFSVKNEDIHKILTILGIKLKFRNFKNDVKIEFNKLNNKLCEQDYKFYELNKKLEEQKDNLIHLNKRNLTWQGIIDNSPNSYKDYVLENNMPEKIKRLKKGLDNKSIKIIDTTLKKILQLPDYKYAEYLYCDDSEFRKTFETKEDVEFNDLYNRHFNKVRKAYKLAKNDYDMEVFLYHHGLKFANEKIKKYVKGKDFIDAGAYIGDSVLVLLNYNPHKIYSFEISDKSINDYFETLKMNAISEDKYQLIKIALSDKKSIIKVSDNGGMGVKIFNKDGYKINTTDLDSIVKEKNINVGFIKADVEGAMYKTLIGMKDTIKNFRPVLSLAIYHSPEEFFETKPLLDEIAKDLNYKIEFDCHYSSCFHIYGTVLWAYPKELED